VDEKDLQSSINVQIGLEGSELTFYIKNNTPFSIQPHYNCAVTQLARDGDKPQATNDTGDISAGPYTEATRGTGITFGIRPSWDITCKNGQPECTDCFSADCTVQLGSASWELKTGSIGYVPTLQLDEDGANVLGYIYSEYLGATDTPYSGSGEPCAKVSYNPEYNPKKPADIYAVLKYLGGDSSASEWSGLLATFPKDAIENYDKPVKVEKDNMILSVCTTDGKITLPSEGIDAYDVTDEETQEKTILLVYDTQINLLDSDDSFVHYYTVSRHGRCHSIRAPCKVKTGNRIDNFTRSDIPCNAKQGEYY